MRKAFCLYKIDVTGDLISPSFITAVVVGIVSVLICTLKIRTYSIGMGEPVNIFEPYLFFGSDIYCRTLSFFGLMFLCALLIKAKPILSSASVRSSHMSVAVSLVLRILTLCLIYETAIAVTSSLCMCDNSYTQNIWSIPFYNIAKGNASASLNISYELRVLREMFPLDAFIVSYVFSVLYDIFCCTIVYLISYAANAAIAYIFVSASHIIGYLCAGTSISHFMPFCHSLLVYHNVESVWGNFGNLGIIESILILSASSIILILGIVLYVCSGKCEYTRTYAR